jgi:hypothetical protein
VTVDRRPPQPPLRRQFDRAERLVGGRLEEIVATRQFTDALILGMRVQVAAFRLLERGSRELLHLVNLPTRSDVMRVSRQLSALDSRVRAIAIALERDDLLLRDAEGTKETDGDSGS